MKFLRQSTSATVIIGPFVDKTDGVTAKTALSDQSANGRLVKNGTGGAITASSWTHDAAGHYAVGLSTSHTDTVGRLRLSFADAATYLPVWEDFTVVEEAVYDLLFASGATGQVTVAAAGLDGVTIESGLNARQALSVVASAVGGVLAGAGTTAITIQGAGVGTTRITATVDGLGNRSAVTLSPPA